MKIYMAHKKLPHKNCTFTVPELKLKTFAQTHRAQKPPPDIWRRGVTEAMLVLTSNSMLENSMLMHVYMWMSPEGRLRGCFFCLSS